MDEWLQRVWYGSARGAWLLLPLSSIFAAVAGLRRWCYRRGLLKSVAVNRPVVVVGNLTAGGTGKTPLILWLAERLREQGLRPGILSRGYGGRGGARPATVVADADPAIVGDEPLMMARRDVAPVVVCRDRGAGARALVSLGADVILSDDGLQHYRLHRDAEIAVIDGRRRFGNGRLLPAGPLREPESRLASVDFVVCNGGQPAPGEIGMELVGDTARRLGDDRSTAVRDFRGRRCHAFAAIGNPQRFFDQLRDAGLDVIAHPLPDHACVDLTDYDIGDDVPVLMTEKDAVKYRPQGTRDVWFIPVAASLDPDAEKIVARIIDLCSEACFAKVESDG